MCMGTFQPNIQKDNGMDVEGYHTYLASTNDNQTYPIKYKISSGAVIEAISSETPSPILNIIVREVPQGGNLTIQLPTKLLGLYSTGGYSVAEGAMCAAIIGTSFPTPIESNLNFTTVEFPLMNYSGVDEMIYITGNYQQPSTTSEFPSPLKQFKSGISPLNVKCSTNYALVIKAEDGSPACVKRNDTDNLMNKPWAINQFLVSIDYRNQGISVIERDSGYQKYENGTFSQTMKIYVFINNFTQSSYSLKVQVLHDDIPYRTDMISSTAILSDGFYKYQFTQSGAIFGGYKIIATYENKTSQISFGNPVPP